MRPSKVSRERCLWYIFCLPLVLLKRKHFQRKEEVKERWKMQGPCVPLSFSLGSARPCFLADVFSYSPPPRSLLKGLRPEPLLFQNLESRGADGRVAIRTANSSSLVDSVNQARIHWDLMRYLQFSHHCSKRVGRPGVRPGDEASSAWPTEETSGCFSAYLYLWASTASSSKWKSWAKRYTQYFNFYLFFLPQKSWSYRRYQFIFCSKREYCSPEPMVPYLREGTLGFSGLNWP